MSAIRRCEKQKTCVFTVIFRRATALIPKMLGFIAKNLSHPRDHTNGGLCNWVTKTTLPNGRRVSWNHMPLQPVTFAFMPLKLVTFGFMPLQPVTFVFMPLKFVTFGFMPLKLVTFGFRRQVRSFRGELFMTSDAVKQLNNLKESYGDYISTLFSRKTGWIDQSISYLFDPYLFQDICWIFICFPLFGFWTWFSRLSFMSSCSKKQKN